MDAIADYFRWAFELGFAGLFVMGIVVPAVAAMLALTGLAGLVSMTKRPRRADTRRGLAD